MDDLIKELVKNGSPLVVLVAVVWMFLSSMRSERDKDRIMLKELNDQHIEARKNTQAALLENAESTRANTRAIQSLESSVMTLVNKKHL